MPRHAEDAEEDEREISASACLVHRICRAGLGFHFSGIHRTILCIATLEVTSTAARRSVEIATSRATE